MQVRLDILKCPHLTEMELHLLQNVDSAAMVTAGRQNKTGNLNILLALKTHADGDVMRHILSARKILALEGFEPG